MQGLQDLLHKLLRELMQQGVAHHGRGQVTEAESIYRAVLLEQPRHADANHNLAVIALGRGDTATALFHFELARDTQPDHWQYWVSYLDALMQAGRIWMAGEVLEEARRGGLAADALDELMERLLAAPTGSGREGVVTSPPCTMARADARAPNKVDIIALTNLLNSRQFSALERESKRLARQHSGNPLGWRMLALALTSRSRGQDAVSPLRRVAELCPGDADNLNSLGMLLVDRNRLMEAEFCFRRAVLATPSHTSAHCNLGLVLQRRGRLQQAESALRQCIALDPDFHVAHLNLSVVQDEMGRSEEAEASVREALRIKPDFVYAHNSLGYLLKDQGNIAQAEASTRRALALEPLNAAANSNLLFVLNYHPDRSAQEIFAAYAQFDARIGLPLKAHWRAHANSRDTRRRLKLGYVCPTFSNHSTRHFLEPLLAYHDHARFEVVAYSEMVSAQDAVTLRYRACFDQWVPTAELSDEALAQRIRDDGIDVLVDIAGHTRGNRLAVFARKPAPVSLHWLDFGYTTGLSAIDYYLTDHPTAPEGSEGLFAETPWRLPVPAFVYRPGSGMGEAGPLPALRRGHVTFGTLTRAIRINHHGIRAWSEILKRVPGSRLVMDSGNFKSAPACEAMAQRFMAHGIDRERLEIGCHSPPWDVLRGIDIGLDCFPHNSGTTLFEMLYMGAPYVTLAGRPSVGRLGSAILQGMARRDWIADSEQEYVNKVVALAQDLDALQAVRASLRAEMLASPLMDERGFARHVENAFVQMFQHWSATGRSCGTGEQPAPLALASSTELMP